ncbi:TetR/AcrR family transcriptional regulator [Blastococcus tunisiensis]|uniref:DNA-binding transcriptional regulator, AcrR family n=1 Tax=Blastococcus tunisiensis TaxID=1798228 RepID=A0A1I2EM50_9ACTN|nr:TetR/AcrR family transcriptional regulator [Blastococcus sp. DSM 46838]SFE93793.1 DNA-binding transcriptional regulator, AcrR family [Blastococcus sp. DSM 46838]
MSDLDGVRAQRKAQTRARILGVARELFQTCGFGDVTVAEVASTAGVSVQTVFNHFATKEELVFAGRVSWVEGPAEAVRARGPQQSALAALHSYLIDWVRAEIVASTTEEHRRFLTTVEDSPALRVYERELHHEAVTRLTEALNEGGDQGWRGEGGRRRGGDPDDYSIIASLTASVWLAAIRALLLDLRRTPPPVPGTAEVAAVVEMTERILDGLRNGSGIASGDDGVTGCGALAGAEPTDPLAAPRQPAGRQRSARQMPSVVAGPIT